MRASVVFGLSAAALCGLTHSGTARAADLGLYEPPPATYGAPDPQFEFGTGWYLRGDASFAPEDGPRLSPVGTGDQTWNYGADAGFGYKLNDYFRADITGDYFQQVGYSSRYTIGTGTTLAQGSLNRYAGLINGYFDLGTWYGVTPYIGAGAGFAVFDSRGSTTITDSAAGTRSFANVVTPDSTNFAWAVMVGASYSLSQNAAVDLGYRHIDLGRYGTALGPFSFNKDFTRDEIRLGLRYMIF